MIVAIAIASLLQDPTWHQDVEPIVARRCMPCHEEGGSGPFAFDDPTSVSSRGTFVLEVMKDGLMPPWLPDDQGPALRGVRDISDEEIATIERWFSAGAPVGCPPAASIPALAILPPVIARAVMPEAWMTPAEGAPRWHEGTRDKQTFVLPLGNDQPLRLTGFAIYASAPRVVHSMNLLLDASGDAATLDTWDEGPGYEMMGDVKWSPSGAHGSIGPGGGVLALPWGFHWEAASGSDLVAETHYRPSGRQELLVLSLEVYGGASRHSRALQPLVTAVHGVDIAPGDRDYAVGEVLPVPVDVDLVAITPRAGPQCSSMTLAVVMPSGIRRTLLSIGDWDPHWCETYVLVHPMRLPAGSRLVSHWTFDNSSSNPRNPFDPPRPITLARRTGIAACILHVAPEDSSEADELARFDRAAMRKRLPH